MGAQNSLGMYKKGQQGLVKRENIIKKEGSVIVKVVFSKRLYESMTDGFEKEPRLKETLR
ncbi:MAG TPA: hypothetical protein VLD83_05520 [Candidatus Binatia bacterium]|nr:hypothetical protein [Candidatus Binatia bacterium]